MYHDLLDLGFFEQDPLPNNGIKLDKIELVGSIDDVLFGPVKIACPRRAHQLDGN